MGSVRPLDEMVDVQRTCRAGALRMCPHLHANLSTMLPLRPRAFDPDFVLENSGSESVPVPPDEPNGPDASSASHHSQICPTCGQQLSGHHCKLVCTQCGYYMSCADYY